MTWPGVTPDEKNTKKVTDSNTPEKLSVDAHRKSDLDSSQAAQHHTLGISYNQASPGDHQHDGKTSRKIDAADIANLTSTILSIISANAGSIAVSIRPQILAGATFTGSRNSDGWRQQVMDAFEAMGATDSTSA
jgi:hypothetical protein